MTTTPTPPLLPGQAHLTDGAIDHTGMYVMHFAVRRDLDDLVGAVGSTPPDDAVRWRALGSYWLLFDDLLHHHHVAEDDHYWPAVAAAVERRGVPADHATIAAMQVEHARIGPSLDGCRSAVERVLTEPSPSAATDLLHHLTELRRIVVDHMAHEETEALPLVDRVMTPSEHARVERAIGRSHPLRLMSRMVPWALHGLPPTTERQLLATAGAPQRLLLRLGRGRFERGHRAAFARPVAELALGSASPGSS